MENCRKCSIELVEGNNWLTSMKNCSNYKCKTCHKKIVNKHYHNNAEVYKASVKQNYIKSKSGYNVYLLEDDNYVGVTENMKYRMAVHKHYGKNTEKVRVLYKAKDREEALELEALLHDMGYEGKHLNNRYL